VTLETEAMNKKFSQNQISHRLQYTFMRMSCFPDYETHPDFRGEILRKLHAIPSDFNMQIL
jgi:hypothetical protein